MTSMECIICDSDMQYHFTKKFAELRLDNVDYWRCVSCGFSASKTHFELSVEDWERLNNDFHDNYFGRDDNPYNRAERYFAQAQLISLLVRHDILKKGAWLDWGCGIGSLAKQLKDNFDLRLNNYDKFTRPHLNEIQHNELKPRSYSLVTNAEVFEHVRDRDTLEEIEQYVADDGCLAVHTLVCGSIPKDPNWMYLLPVHCAFHTNQSMRLLLEQWGYQCSLYNPIAKMWFMFKSDPQQIEKKASDLNEVMGWNYVHFKNGFMDYWP